MGSSAVRRLLLECLRNPASSINGYKPAPGTIVCSGLKQSFSTSNAIRAQRDKILCVGKNYVEHAKEMGDKSDKPVLFLKPFSIAVEVSGVGDTARVELPRGRGSVHYEAEILLKLGDRKTIEAVSLGLDLTLRDVQAKLKALGQPWEISKAFRGAAVIGPWVAVTDFPDYLEDTFTFKLDGELKQQGQGKQMRLSPSQILDHLEEHFPLCPGDVVFTGTPHGVGPVQPGQLGQLQWGDKIDYKVAFT